MARFSFQIPQEFFDELERAGRIDDIAKKTIEASAPILEKAIKKESHKHDLTGEMTESVKTTKVTKNKYGYIAVVRPTGVDQNGIRNMEKMAWNEYGFYHANGMEQIPAKPIMTKATNEVRQSVLDNMQKIYNEEVGK